MASVLVVVCDGCEDSEVVVPVDVMRRGGIEVDVASAGGEHVVCAQGVVLRTEKLLDAVDKVYDGVVIPGGPGVRALSRDKRVGEILRRHEGDGKLVCAICAAPTVLQAHGVGSKERMTIYPSMRERLGDRHSSERVCESGNVVTSQGPGTALEFGLRIVRRLAGQDAEERVRREMVA